MATFYVDLENGNDANDGLSFANRWKTLTNGATSARITAGDVIRVMGSLPANSIGAAQWTDGSVAIAPSAPKNKAVPGFTSAWTAAANITVTQGNTSSIQKTSETYLQIAPSTAFTSGKMAHVALGSPLDLSGYQQLSFWMQKNTTVSAVDLQLNLCSDSNGDTPLLSLTIPASAGFTSGAWRVIVLDNGAALPSGINSISISAPVDPSTVIFRFCNVVACKAKNSADEITHLTLIGKKTAGEPWWYNLNEITDTELRLGGSHTQLNTVSPARPYKGVTESVTTYTLNPIRLSGSQTINDGGSYTAPITVSGGWNRTDMSTQDSETWVSGSHYFGAAFSAISGYHHIKFDGFGAAHLTASVASLQNGWEFDLVGAIGCKGPTFGGSPATAIHPQFCKLKVKQIWGGTAGVIDVPFSAVFDADLIHGFTDNASTSSVFETNAARIGDARPNVFKVKEISNNGGAGIEIPTADSARFIGTLLKDNAADLQAADLYSRCLRLEGCTLQSATKIRANSSQYAYRVEEVRIGGNPLANRTTLLTGYWESQQAVVRTAGGVAWALYPTDADYNARFPLKMPLGKVAVEANKLVTVKYHVRRTNTALTCGIMVEGVHPGVTETLVPVTAAADTWEELTLTFTPTVAGVVEIMGYAYGGTTYTAYFDDPTITQAD